MVIYRGADGKPGYQQAEDIHDAVTFVEQMRNEEGVEQARIFRLEEVVFEYRPYYRVELDSRQTSEITLSPPVPNGSTPPPPPMAPSTSTASPAAVVEESSADGDQYDEVESTTINLDEPDGEVVAGNGARKGLFGR